MKDPYHDLNAFGDDLGLPRPDERPVVTLPGGTVSIRDTATALFTLAAQQNALFIYGGKIVTLVRPNKEKPRPEVLGAVEACSEFEKYATFVKRKNGKLFPEIMKEAVARTILGCDVAKELLPTLTSLIDAPLLVLHEGRLKTLKEGFDPKTGLYVTGTAAHEPESLDDAVKRVQTVIVDFNFQTPSDKARAIAAIIGPALRFGGFLNGPLPIEIIEAPGSQIGKGFLLLRRAAVYGEEPLTLSKQTGGVGSLDETFGSALLHGRPFITLDNLRDKLNSPFLESFLTARGSFSVRTPHRGQVTGVRL